MQLKRYRRLGSSYLMRVLLITVTGIIILTACSSSQPSITDLSASANAATVTKAATIAPPATDTAVASPTVIEETVTDTAEPPTQTPSPTATPIIYVVQELDTLWDIALQFGTSTEAILRANNIADGGLIQIGQELLIPPASSGAEQEATATPLIAAATTITGTLPAEVTLSVTPASAAPTPSPVSERGVLPNYVLCPEEESPIPEGAQLVGYSAVCHLPMVSYQFGNGDTPLILVGGMHGGYEWNTIALAYEVLDYLQANPGFIPPELTVYLIPNANPDGLYAVTKQSGRFTRADIHDNTVPGRFNGRNVDLNRNWDCNWDPVSTWRDKEISGGTAPFSEPENQALRQFIMSIDPATVLFWHSAARGVFASGCGAVDPASKAQAQLFGTASGYPVYDSFEHYDITGDASDWLSTQNIPSFTVELATHEFIDWDMNLAGLRALFQNLAAQ